MLSMHLNNWMKQKEEQLPHLLPSIPTPPSVPIVINQNQPTQNLTNAKDVVPSPTATVNVKSSIGKQDPMAIKNNARN